MFSSAESDANSIRRPQLLQELDAPPRTRVTGILNRKPHPLQRICILWSAIFFQYSIDLQTSGKPENRVYGPVALLWLPIRGHIGRNPGPLPRIWGCHLELIYQTFIRNSILRAF
jgi:hypothetical protein